jgi:hypothetical protein
MSASGVCVRTRPLSATSSPRKSDLPALYDVRSVRGLCLSYLRCVLSARRGQIPWRDVEWRDAGEGAIELDLRGNDDVLIITCGAQPSRPNRSQDRPCTSWLRACALAAGVAQRLAHPHALRTYWATSLLEDGVPIHRVSSRLGHADLRTTSRYAADHPDHVDDVDDVPRPPPRGDATSRALC